MSPRITSFWSLHDGPAPQGIYHCGTQPAMSAV